MMILLEKEELSPVIQILLKIIYNDFNVFCSFCHSWLLLQLSSVNNKKKCLIQDLFDVPIMFLYVLSNSFNRRSVPQAIKANQKLPIFYYQGNFLSHLSPFFDLTFLTTIIFVLQKLYEPCTVSVHIFNTVYVL